MRSIAKLPNLQKLHTKAKLKTFVAYDDLNKRPVTRVKECRSVMSIRMESHPVVWLQTTFICDVFQLLITSNATKVLLSRRDVSAHAVSKG